MKLSTKRRDEIVNIVRANQSVRVEWLAQHFSISSVTIRHDLAILENRGCIIRSHGGATLNRHFAFERPLLDKSLLHADLKNKIARKAADFVEDGDSIILDSGSTTCGMVPHLSNKLGLVVMTNSLKIAYELAFYKNIELMVVGGTLRRNSFTLNSFNIDYLSNSYRFNKLFLGVDGFDLDVGITTTHENEAELNRILCKVADEVIAVTDSSKFDRKSFCMITESYNISKVITDNGIPQKYVDGLNEKGVELIIVDR